jgi:hypothetical protein
MLFSARHQLQSRDEFFELRRIVAEIPQTEHHALYIAISYRNI